MKASRAISIRLIHSVLRLASAFIAFVVVLGAVTANGQQNTGTIVGRIISQETLPGRVIVRLFSSGDLPVGEMYTDSHGNFSFLELPAGTFYITVEAQGYKPVRETVNLEYPPTDPRAQVNITLEPLEPEVIPRGQIISGSRESLELNAKAPPKVFSEKALREFEKGRKEERKGHLDAAADHFQKALQFEPDFFPALNNLGTVYLRQKEEAKAEEAFQRAIKLKPQDSQAYINLGHVLFEEGRYPEAISQLEQGVQRSPGSALGRFLLGSAYFKTNSLENAEMNLKQACRLDALHMAPAHLQLANLYLRKGNGSMAEAELEEFLHLSPSDPRAPALREVLTRLKSN